MKSNKITQLHVYIIGVVLALIVGGAGYYFMLRPLYEDNTKLLADIEGIEGQSTTVDTETFQIAKWDPATETDPTPEAIKAVEDKAKAALEGARQRQERKAAELDSMLAKKSLPASQTVTISNDLNENLQRAMRAWFTLPEFVVSRMGRYARNLGAAHGVTVTTQFKAPAPSTDPAAIPRDIIAWNLGQMTVRGKFQNVMKWAEAWNRAPLLVSVDGLKMSVADRGGVVEGTCTLTVFMFPKGEAVTIPGQGGGGGAAPAGPGGFGGAVPNAETGNMAGAPPPMNGP